MSFKESDDYSDEEVSVTSNLPDVNSLVLNEFILISDVVKRDVLMFRYHSRNSELYQLLDLLTEGLESIVSRHNDVVKYLVIMNREESYLPISFTSHKNALETIASLDSCLANQSSALSAFNTRERLIELVLNSKHKIEELTSFSQNLTSLAFQLNEANNFVKNNMDELLE